MGAIGSRADNALTESFNATLKREALMDARSCDDELTCRRQTFRWLNRVRHRAPPLLLRPPTPNHLQETDLGYYAGNRRVNQPPCPTTRNKAPEWTLHTYTHQPATPEQILTTWHTRGQPPRQRIPTTPTSTNTTHPADWGTTPTPQEEPWPHKGWAGRTPRHVT